LGGVLILTSPLFCEWRSHSTMSAFGGKADIDRTVHNSAKAKAAELRSAAKA